MRRKPNALLARPAAGSFEGRLHRAGEYIGREIERTFRTYGLYDGVHVGTRPFVAAAYALARLRVDPYGLEITNAPVIIGLKRGCGVPQPDVDVYTTAIALNREAEEIYSQIEDEYGEGLDEFEVRDAFEEMREGWGDYDPVQDIAGTVNLYDERDLMEDYGGIGGVFGTFANLPTSSSAAEALEEVVVAVASGYGGLDQALKEALKIVPQRRFVCDIEWEDVAFVAVMKPYAPRESSPDYEEVYPYASSADALYVLPEVVDDDSAYDAFDEVATDGWLVLYGDPDQAAYWHGTGSKALLSAFPEARRYVDLEEVSDYFVPQRSTLLAAWEEE